MLGKAEVFRVCSVLPAQLPGGHSLISGCFTHRGDQGDGAVVGGVTSPQRGAVCLDLPQPQKKKEIYISLQPCKQPRALPFCARHFCSSPGVCCDVLQRRELSSGCFFHPHTRQVPWINSSVIVKCKHKELSANPNKSPRAKPSNETIEVFISTPALTDASRAMRPVRTSMFILPGAFCRHKEIE